MPLVAPHVASRVSVETESGAGNGRRRGDRACICRKATQSDNTAVTTTV